MDTWKLTLNVQLPGFSLVDTRKRTDFAVAALNVSQQEWSLLVGAGSRVLVVSKAAPFDSTWPGHHVVHFVEGLVHDGHRSTGSGSIEHHHFRQVEMVVGQPDLPFYWRAGNQNQNHWNPQGCMLVVLDFNHHLPKEEPLKMETSGS